MKITSLRLLAYAGALALTSSLGVSAAQGVTETNDAQFSSNGGAPFTPTYTAPANNLLLGLTASSSSNIYDFQQEASTGLPVLTDGVFGTFGIGSAAANHQSLAVAQSGQYVTYTLAQASSVTRIVTLGGWNDSGRSQQEYTVSYQVGGAGNFIQLASVNYNPGNGNGAQIATQVTLDGFGTIDNVTAIRFDFASGMYGYVGYAELAAVGAVPEPSTWAAAGLGTLGLVMLRLRRSRRA